MAQENNQEDLDNVLDNMTSLISTEIWNLKQDVLEIKRIREINFPGSDLKSQVAISNDIEEKNELKDTLGIFMLKQLTELHKDLSSEIKLLSENFKENRSDSQVIDWVHMTNDATDNAIMTSQMLEEDNEFAIPDAITMLAEQTPITVTICEAQNGEITTEKQIKTDEYEVEMIDGLNRLKNSKKLGKEKQTFQCNVCYKIFERSSALQAHVVTHKADKPFQCKYCGKGYRCRENFEDHEQKHEGEKSHKCLVCGEEFAIRRNLWIHSKIHRNVDNMEIENTKSGPVRFCQVCGKNFASNVALETHLRVHTGEKPYGCEICGKKFTSKAYLPIHRRQHTGQKPFTCEVCGKAFNEKTNVVKHMRIHNGEKPYQCEVCGKNFGTASHVKAHSRVHTGARPYKCTICGHAYSKNQSLRMHMAKVHPNPIDAIFED